MIPKLSLWALLMLILSVGASGQYWFGPRLGVHRVDHIYQESTYKSDSFNVKPDYNYQFGVVFDYTANARYSVHTEINYEKVGTDLKNKIGTAVKSSMNAHFLSVPLMLRVSFGRQPSHWYVNGGPKLSYWMGGKGTIYEASFDENIRSQRKYKIVFSQSKANEDLTKYKAVTDGNRVQYALALGAGSYLDMAAGGRLNFDVRYTFGHSNMGFNRNPNFVISNNYTHNFKYRNYMLSASVSYILEYNAQLQRKGGSTIKDSRR